MSKTVVSSDNAPAAIGPYSPGIQTGNMVFLSGQLGIDPATGKMPEGVEAQAKQSLANVEALLTAAGATFADVVKTTVYLADIADFAAVNEIYASKFEAPFPARSAFPGCRPSGWRSGRDRGRRRPLRRWQQLNMTCKRPCSACELQGLLSSDESLVEPRSILLVSPPCELFAGSGRRWAPRCPARWRRRPRRP